MVRFIKLALPKVTKATRKELRVSILSVTMPLRLIVGQRPHTRLGDGTKHILIRCKLRTNSSEIQPSGQPSVVASSPLTLMPHMSYDSQCKVTKVVVIMVDSTVEHSQKRSLRKSLAMTDEDLQE